MSQEIFMQNNVHNDFLGIGWKFPPKFSEDGKTITMVNNEENVHQSLFILLTTIKGQRMLRSNFHCDLQPFVYQNVDYQLINDMRNTIEQSILIHESRINLERVEVIPDNEEPGVVYICIYYRICNSNSRQNILFPYYLNESTNIRPMEVTK